MAGMRAMFAFCALLQQGQSMRQGASAEGKELVGVLNSISTLLQSHGYTQADRLTKIATTGQESVTPGLHAAFGDIAQRAADQIRSEVQQLIRDGHQSTQDAIDKTVNDLDAATGVAVSKKETAVDLDKSWVACVGEEKDLRVEVEKAAEALAAAITVWQTKRGDCSQNNEARVEAMCSFGEAYQNKCQMLTSYHSHSAAVDAENGGEYSHPDRVSEWQTTAVTACMLDAAREEAVVNEQSLAACEAAVDFSRDVGDLDRKATDLARLTEPSKFTCSEEAIEFSGETWDVPVGEEPASSEYINRPFVPQVSSEPGSAPFALCESEEPGKA
jgi:hypothetical protein